MNGGTALTAFDIWLIQQRGGSTVDSHRWSDTYPAGNSKSTPCGTNAGAFNCQVGDTLQVQVGSNGDGSLTCSLNGTSTRHTFSGALVSQA